MINVSNGGHDTTGDGQNGWLRLVRPVSALPRASVRFYPRPSAGTSDAISSRLIRCAALTPVPDSRAVLRMPVPRASSARITSTLARGEWGLTDRLSALGSVLASPRHPGLYPLLDNRPLELREDPEHLEEGAPGWGGRVNRLAFEIQITSHRV